VSGDALTTQPHLGCNSPAVVFSEILDELRNDIVYAPRSLQKRIGPSGLGDPCPRGLIGEMFNLHKPPEPPNLRAWVGTSIHQQLERIIARSPLQLAGDEPRYLLERKVNVGSIGGVDITGSVDCFDVLSGTVIDYKSKSHTRLQEHRRHGPGQVYRVQGHCYGLGMRNLGYHVNQVMFIYLPRDGLFADITYHAETFDPQIAFDALARANSLHALATLLGPQVAMDQYPRCDGEFCRHCRRSNRGAADLAGLMSPPVPTGNTQEKS
jgi:hypothetical protein